MPHSHADYPQLTCPQCGAAFTAEVWLIVDTAERPDLPARVIDGSLHRVVCPNGHAAEVDAPLLLFRPGEEPPLVFSPAQGTTAEQDQEIAAGLVGRLREALGGDWRDEWLEDAANVPRRLLPALLSGDAAALREAMAAAVPPEVAAILAELAADGVTLERPEDLERALEARPALRARLEAALGETSQDDGDAPQEPPDGMTLPPEIARLLQTLQQFIEAPNWLESYRFMLAHPELVSDEAGALLSALLDAATAQGDENAIAVLGDHRDLLRRCREIGAAAAFAEKLGVTTDQLEAALGGDSTGGGVDVPPAFRDDLQRTQVAEQRYQATGDRAALDEATAAWERILNAPGFPAAPERFQLAAFNGAGGVFLRRYRAGGCLPDLDRALALWQTAVARTPADSPDRAAIQNNLGNGLRARYGRTGRPQDLDAAIAAYEDAVARTPADSPDRAGRLNNLGTGLRARYGRTGRPQDLDAAIAAYEDAVARTPADSPDRAAIQNNLGNGLSDRYGRTGRPQDLDAAIAAYEDAVARTPADSPDRAGRLNNLGNGLRARYGRTGRPQDLDAAIAAFEDAVARTPADSPDRAGRLNNLGNGLSARYGRTGRPQDLDAAIAAYEDAVARTPADSPDRAGYLNNLGNGLSDRYGRTGRPQDLDAAIAAYEDAVARTPADSPDRAGRLNNLGTGLRDRYGRTGRPQDLDAAIAAYEDAVARTPADSPDRAAIQNNLGNGLSDRYGRTGRPQDLDAAIAAYEDAVARTPADSPDRAGRLNNLGNGLRDRYGRTGRPQDLDAAIAAYEDAVARTPADSPDRAGYLNNLGTGLRDRYGRTGRPQDLDAAIAAYEDAVACTPADSPDRASYLNNLGNGLRDRYGRTGRPQDLDAAIAAFEDAVARTPADSPDRAGRLNNLGNGLSDRYGRTGRPQDLDAAIAAYEDAVARTPADSPDRAGWLNNLGTGLSDRYGRTGRPQDLDAAIAAYEDAVARTPADSPDRAGRLNNLGNGLRARYGRTGRPQDLDAAIAAYTAALDGINESFQAVAVGYITNAQRQWAGLYARATTALLAAGRPAEALAVAEGSKSRLLTLLMSRGDLPAPPVIPAALVDAERAAAARLSAIDAAALGDHNRAGSEPGEVIRQRSAARAALVAELRAAWQAMAELGPEAADYVSLRRGDRPTAAGLARLAGELPAGTALLSLFDTGETVTAPDGEAGERRRVLLFLLRAGAAGPVVLEAALDPDALYYDYLANYEEEVLDPRRRRALRALGRPLTGRWRALGRPLLGPLLPHLDGIDHLIIAPEGVYHQLPLHALWIGAADSGLAGTTLLDHCAVSYIPALGLLERLVGAPAAPGDLSGRSAVFGYTDADPTTERGAREREIFLGEAAAVAGRLGVEPLLDDAATGAALEAATARPLRRLHLSCHGYFNGQDALASGVLLANGAGGSVVYTARQFMTHRLPVELVTLSACQTAISGSLGGDEMAGLSMGLLSAGARSLLLGQWSVNAQTTEKLMVWFYALLDGAGGPRATKAETLRRVMLAFRDGRILLPGKGFDPADPYYWAPFVLVGNWR